MQYATICSNSGTMGTPVAEGIFGQEGVFLSAIFLIPLRIAMWTLGIAFFSGKWEKGVVRLLLMPAAVLLACMAIDVSVTLPPSGRSLTPCSTAFSTSGSMVSGGMEKFSA